jgi:DUF1680 family protein
MYAGLRDACRYAATRTRGHADCIVRLDAGTDFAPERRADAAMLRSEHGGMNEVLADVSQMTGQQKYLDLAMRFSHQAILRPLEEGKDQLTGLHANTQIPKVIGFKRIGE